MKALPPLLVFLSVVSGCVTANRPSAASAVKTIDLNANSTNPSDNSMSERDAALNSIKIERAEATRTGDITVQILNVSKKPVRLWEDANSWGAGRWRILVLRRGQLETFFQIASQIFTLNRPSFNEIAAGGRLEQKLHLNGGNWCGLGHCTPFYERGFGGKNVSFEPNDTVIVIYDVHVTQEARDNGVWYGVIAATAGVSSNGPLKTEGSNPSRGSSKMNESQNSMLPVEKSIHALRLDRVEVSRTAQITLELQNISKERLRAWKDSNSWGASCWRVLLSRNGSLQVFFQNPDQDFTRNGPTFDEIPGGGHLDQKLDLNGGNWCGMGHCSIHSERGLGGKTMTFEPNDTVIVIYDVPVTQDGRDNGVWHGVIAATATVQ